MEEHPNVTLTLIRFTASNSNEIVGETARSKLLDAEILSDFKLQSERLLYREELVANGMGVVAVTKSLGNAYDIVMVGRHHVELQIMSQLTKWNTRGELGAVGEILAASDFREGASALVVQQQTRLWGLHEPEEFTH